MLNRSHYGKHDKVFLEYSEPNVINGLASKTAQNAVVPEFLYNLRLEHHMQLCKAVKRLGLVRVIPVDDKF